MNGTIRLRVILDMLSLNNFLAFMIIKRVGRIFSINRIPYPVFLIDYPVALARCIGGGDQVPLSACGWSGQYKRKTILND